MKIMKSNLSCSRVKKLTLTKFFQQEHEHCFKVVNSSKNSWYIDSGCSRNMTGDKSNFIELKPKSGGEVTFGDNSKGQIEEIDSIGYSITSVRRDHGTDLQNLDFENFCISNGISHNFSAPGTPQQNRVVERKNRTLEEMARTMLCKNNLPKYFWVEATNTACYILNRVMNRLVLKKNPYELFKNKKPNISYFHPFGCKYFVLNNGKDNFAYRVFKKITLVVEESIHVFDDANLFPRKDTYVDDDDVGVLNNDDKVDHSSNDKIREQTKEALKELTLEEREVNHPREYNYVKDGKILGDPSKEVATRSSLRNKCNYVAFISCIKLKNIKEILNYEYWLLAMQIDLNQFERSNVWTFVGRPCEKSNMGTKNKLDESGNILRNKARLVAQGYT
ncbi:Retrovirus-related Pol polyprotein from transposon TNT 1-94 [Gossypium australe]|uniref:Retrovirus-related Pol polyprotein from transposon TNT 1-94 n=1 Tax=Gossypium australe TaxID=47621 RepID=A0A5B6X154_9ROSI|nr:Retrovirus-related Pol polyprotein from transposon TNT 1-94 [Gossypium australe]